jgi:hypothetical protein
MVKKNLTNETPIFRLKKLCLDRAFADRIKNVYKEEVTYILQGNRKDAHLLSMTPFSIPTVS